VSKNNKIQPINETLQEETSRNEMTPSAPELTEQNFLSVAESKASPRQMLPKKHSLSIPHFALAKTGAPNTQDNSPYLLGLKQLEDDQEEEIGFDS
jgi:hypothetical protein